MNFKHISAAGLALLCSYSNDVRCMNGDLWQDHFFQPALEKSRCDAETLYQKDAGEKLNFIAAEFLNVLTDDFNQFLVARMLAQLNGVKEEPETKLPRDVRCMNCDQWRDRVFQFILEACDNKAEKLCE